MTKRANMTNTDRREQMIQAGVSIATERHPDLVTGVAIAEICGCTPRLVYLYLGNNTQIQGRVNEEMTKRG